MCLLLAISIEQMYHVKDNKKYIGEKYDMNKAHGICERYKEVLPNDVEPCDVYEAIAEVIHPEHMARISVVTRKQAKRLLPKQHRLHVGRVSAWYDAQNDKVFVIALCIAL